MTLGINSGSDAKTQEISEVPDFIRKIATRSVNLFEAAKNEPVARERPAAKEVVAGIQKAAKEGRIAAWCGGGDRDLEPVQQSDGGWVTCCVAHNDHNPSLVISDVLKDGRRNTLFYCRSGCTQDAVIAAIDRIGPWDCVPGTIEAPEAMGSAQATQSIKRTRGNGAAVLVIPEDAPAPPDHHYDLGPASACWPYRNSKGEAVFNVRRFDPNDEWKRNYANAPKHRRVEKPDRKTFRPQCFWQAEDGTRQWRWVAPKTGVPLYGSDELAGKPTANVIVCEGEKATDAARRLFPDCVAVTWCGGAKAVAKAPWQELNKRRVLIWPDHDEAGSQAAHAIRNALASVDCASIAILDAKALASIDPANIEAARIPPMKWDAANAEEEWTDLASLRKEVDRNSNAAEDRVRVELSPDNIGETVSKAEDVLRNSGLPIFKRGGCIVRVGQYQEKSTDGQTQRVLTAQKLSPSGLGEVLEDVIRFEQYDARKKSMKPTHAPELLLKTFIDRGPLAKLKPLTGLTDSPLIRHDGTLLDEAGYDEATGIFYQPTNLDLTIPDDPTFADAAQAVTTLKSLIRDFPFQSEVDLSAAISALISAVNRPTLRATPLHAFSAPTPASGKSLLASLATLISTGSLPSFITQGEDDEELEKRIAAQMLAGRRVINIDNCDRPLKGSALCNLLTAEFVSLRILGRSEMPDIPASALIVANGNNMRLAGDMVRRTVICNIDPQCERPEERTINWDAKAEARQNRGMYVSACLTIMLAYQAAGAPKQQTAPLGGFEDWSRRVRDAIVWTGLPDPCGNAGKLRDADPEKERFLGVAEQWSRHFGSREVRIAEVVAKAQPTFDPTKPQDAGTKDLATALMAVANAGRDINANRLGAWLSRYAGRPIAGFRFTGRVVHGGAKAWRLEKADP